jgi:putative ABC transport system permease protein
LPDIISTHQNAPFLRVEYGPNEVANVRNVIRMVHILLQLGIVASLGLGGFGIWHSSFASVRERTREIGLKLAMGAEQEDIAMQFLGEALFSALLGGLVGIAVGIFAVGTLSLALDLPFSVLKILFNIPICLIAATMVGAVGGVYPAMQAGRMDVAVALRFE